MLNVRLDDVAGLFEPRGFHDAGRVGAVHNASVAVLLLDRPPPLLDLLNELEVDVRIVRLLDQIPVAGVQRDVILRGIGRLPELREPEDFPEFGLGVPLDRAGHLQGDFVVLDEAVPDFDGGVLGTVVLRELVSRLPNFFAFGAELFRHSLQPDIKRLDSNRPRTSETKVILTDFFRSKTSPDHALRRDFGDHLEVSPLVCLCLCHLCESFPK